MYDERNLVVATTFPIFSVQQLRNDLVATLSYRRLTANPPDAAAVTIGIERPILHVQLDLPGGNRLHVVNVHLKSKIPTDIPGQKIDGYTWRSADAWAEGSFISSMKRMSQALEVLVDQPSQHPASGMSLACEAQSDPPAASRRSTTSPGPAAGPGRSASSAAAMTENAVKQFAWRNKEEVGELRAELLVGLRAACNGALQYRVDVLKQIVQEADERLADLEAAWKAQEGWTVAGHAVWNAYHGTWCRYRELQVEIVRQIQEETDPSARRAREEAEVDIDQLFDSVCPQCREPISTA